MTTIAPVIMLIWAGAAGSSTSVHHIPFSTMEACQQAKELIRKEWPTRFNFKMICLPTEFKNDERT